METARDILVIISCALGSVGWVLIIAKFIREFFADRKMTHELRSAVKDIIEKEKVNE